MAQRRSGRALRRSARLGLAALAVTLAWVPGAGAFVRALDPERGPLAVLHSGVVWIDEGRVLFRGFWSGTTTLGGIGESEPQIAASGRAVALLSASKGFSGAIPPHRLVPIGQIYEGVRGGGCGIWVPQVGSQGDFVVAGDELIVAAECQGEGELSFEGEASYRQPLFVHDIRGGHWRVLRWLGGHEPPVLASEGDLLAVGVQREEASTTMRVSVFDVAGGRRVARFEVPSGGLSFASPRRLLLAVPTQRRVARKAGGTLLAGGEQLSPSAVVRIPPPRLELYSLRGRRVADLGLRYPPLVSEMHVLREEESSESLQGSSTLFVGGLVGGPSRQLIGFREQARSLFDVAFRWPAVAVLQTVSAPLAQGEVTCTSGLYHRHGPPSLRVFDLARHEPFIPPPPAPGVVRPAGCPRVAPPRL